jgi:putative CocE/NonD family hydrolase
MVKLDENIELLIDYNKDFLPKPIFKEYSTSSSYIPMRDGVKIAIDIYLPEGLPSDEKISAVLLQTRYWRATKLRIPFKYLIKSLSKKDYIKAFTNFGYAVLIVDVRGSGASFGYRISPWSEDEVRDDGEIVDWIINQPWSNGNVISLGSSYAGTTAELVAVANHPAVKGIVPMHNEIDPYLDIAFPGGIFNEWFVSAWAHYNDCLDRNSMKGLGLFAFLLLKSVKPVKIDKDKKMLRDAIQQHSSNLNVYEAGKNIVFRNDRWEDKTIRYFSVYRYINEIEKSNVPIYYWGSWMDGATSNVVLESFLTFSNPFIGIIGAWSHGAIWYASPFTMSKKEVIPNYEFQYRAFVSFFDACIKEKSPSEKTLYYYTMGEERWKKTNYWPPSGQTKKKWYFSSDSMLSASKPTEDKGSDDYKINFKTTTGKKCNRWYTQLGYFVKYKNRAKRDQKLLHYTSTPLESDIEVTGYPHITLFLKSTHEDGAIFAYLEDVDSKGNVFLLTEGQFRLIHRKISDNEPPYKIMVPYHTYKKEDSLPLKPGEITEITFGLLPTSVLIRKGHRLRVAIAGADKDTFLRIPSEGNPVITIERNTRNASFIDLPIIING